MYHSRGTIYSKVASKPMCLGNINRTTVQNTNETLSYLLPRIITIDMRMVVAYDKRTIDYNDNGRQLISIARV